MPLTLKNRNAGQDKMLLPNVANGTGIIKVQKVHHTPPTNSEWDERRSSGNQCPDGSRRANLSTTVRLCRTKYEIVNVDSRFFANFAIDSHFFAK